MEKNISLPLILLFLFVILSSCNNDKGITVNEHGLSQGSILARMEAYKVPGVSIAVVKNGEIIWAKGFGVANTNNGQKVETDTLFQAASISKPITALAALKLVEDGNLELDEDINPYLKSWKIPDSKYSKNEKVTLRRLLTHTSGINVHGFPGYKQSDNFPVIDSVLKGLGNTSPIKLKRIPGSKWDYSGGGYVIIGKLLEDITNLPFETYMKEFILQPIGMDSSIFEQPLPQELHSMASAAYNKKGKIIDGLWHNYPEQAAGGLWTTPTDLAKYCIEIQEILNGKPDGILQRGMVDQMLTKHKNDWGLGMYIGGEGNKTGYEHDGKNAGFVTYLVSFPYQKNAAVIMTNGDNGEGLIEEILSAIIDFYAWEL